MITEKQFSAVSTVSLLLAATAAGASSMFDLVQIPAVIVAGLSAVAAAWAYVSFHGRPQTDLVDSPTVQPAEQAQGTELTREEAKHNAEVIGPAQPGRATTGYSFYYSIAYESVDRELARTLAKAALSEVAGQRTHHALLYRMKTHQAVRRHNLAVQLHEELARHLVRTVYRTPAINIVVTANTIETKPSTPDRSVELDLISAVPLNKLAV